MDIGLLLLRLAVGLTIAAHGAQMFPVGLAGRDSQKPDSFSRRWGSHRDVVTLC